MAGPFSPPPPSVPVLQVRALYARGGALARYIAGQRPLDDSGATKIARYLLRQAAPTASYADLGRCLHDFVVAHDLPPALAAVLDRREGGAGRSMALHYSGWTRSSEPALLAAWQAWLDSDETPASLIARLVAIPRDRPAPVAAFDQLGRAISRHARRALAAATTPLQAALVELHASSSRVHLLVGLCTAARPNRHVRCLKRGAFEVDPLGYWWVELADKGAGSRRRLPLPAQVRTLLERHLALLVDLAPQLAAAGHADLAGAVARALAGRGPLMLWPERTDEGGYRIADAPPSCRCEAAAIACDGPNWRRKAAYRLLEVAVPAHLLERVVGHGQPSEPRSPAAYRESAAELLPVAAFWEQWLRGRRWLTQIL